MLIAEISVTRAAAGKNTDPLRAVVSSTILVAGCLALIPFVLVLSSAILPSRKVLLVLALIVAAAVVILRRNFIRLHARAQAALADTLTHPPAPRHETAPELPALMRDAELNLVTITPQSAAAGKLIGELAIRTATGASIVGIERSGENIVNPGPDEELRAEDRVLLLGSRTQLDAAQTLLTGGVAL